MFKTTDPAHSPLFPAQAGVVTRFRFPAAGGGGLPLVHVLRQHRGSQCGRRGQRRGGRRRRRHHRRTDGARELPTTRGAYDRTWAGATDGFVSRLSANGAQLLYSTFFGGASDDADLFRITPLIDRVGGNTVLVAGGTGSPDFPTTAGAFQTASGDPPGSVGGGDGYVMKIALDADDSGDLTVDPPALFSPANGATFGRTGFLTLQWSAVSDPSGIEAYHYPMSTRPDFPDNFLAYSGSVRGTSVVLSPPGEVTWFWRVQTADRAGNLSAWSATSTFTLGGGGSAPPVVSSVGTSPTSVIGGSSATAIAYLTAPVPAGGAVIRLSASRSNFPFDPSRETMPVTLPASVNVPAGATQATFVIGTVPVTSSVPVEHPGHAGWRRPEGIALREPPRGRRGDQPGDDAHHRHRRQPGDGQGVHRRSGPGGRTAGDAVQPAPEHRPRPRERPGAGRPRPPRPSHHDVAGTGGRGRAVRRPRQRLELDRGLVGPAQPSHADRLHVESRHRRRRQVATGTVSFSAPMPSAEWPANIDQYLTVWSSDPDVASIGFRGVAVLCGATSATFQVFTVGAPTNRTATFFAAFDQVTRSAALAINAAAPISLSSVTLQPAAVSGGQGGIGRVNLSADPRPR